MVRRNRQTWSKKTSKIKNFNDFHIPILKSNHVKVLRFLVFRPMIKSLKVEGIGSALRGVELEAVLADLWLHAFFLTLREEFLNYL